MLTQEQIAEIQARADAATDGPWKVGANHAAYIYDKENQPVGNFTYGANGKQNCDFTAHARADIPALLAHIAELEKNLEDALQRIASEYGDD